MCIIVVCQDKWPSEEELKNCFDANGHGAGMAWVDYDKKQVVYEKGLKDHHDILKIINSGKVKFFPAIIHFRIASSGGISDELTHPFPLTKDVPTALKGRAPGVLFHNGTWSGWSDKLLAGLSADPSGKIPDGEWSDTRALAWFVARGGAKMLNFLYNNINGLKPDKIAVLTGKGELMLKGEWERGMGFIASNTGFRWKRYHTSSPTSFNQPHLVDKNPASNRPTPAAGAGSSSPSSETSKQRLLGPGPDWTPVGPHPTDIGTPCVDDGIPLPKDYLELVLVGLREIKKTQRAILASQKE